MKKSVKFGLTEDHFQIALSNGISRKNVRQRFWDYGWEIEKAISHPIMKEKGGRRKMAMEKQEHLNAVGEITEMVYKAVHGEDE